MFRRECNCQPPFTVQLGESWVESWVELTLPTFAHLTLFNKVQEWHPSFKEKRGDINRSIRQAGGTLISMAYQ